MDMKENILQELQHTAPLLADISRLGPYQVPPGYFDGLSNAVLAITGMETMVFASATEPTFKVPEGYFEGLSANILQKIKSENTMGEGMQELESIAPLLNTISRENVYTVPAGYFENADFAAAAKAKKEGKVITLRIARKWMQYAAAAVMAGILVTGAFIFTNDKSNLPVESDSAVVSSALNKVSEADLVTYLDNPEHFVAAPAATSLASEAELADVKNNIRKVSDEELSQYLKENAENFETVVSEKE